MAGAITTAMPVLMDILRALIGAGLPLLKGDGTNWGSSFSADRPPTLAPANHSAVRGNGLAGALSSSFLVNGLRGSTKS
jgi:hypothetical protein